MAENTGLFQKAASVLGLGARETGVTRSGKNYARSETDELEKTVIKKMEEACTADPDLSQQVRTLQQQKQDLILFQMEQDELRKVEEERNAQMKGNLELKQAEAEAKAKLAEEKFKEQQRLTLLAQKEADEAKTQATQIQQALDQDTTNFYTVTPDQKLKKKYPYSTPAGPNPILEEAEKAAKIAGDLAYKKVIENGCREIPMSPVDMEQKETRSSKSSDLKELILSLQEDIKRLEKKAEIKTPPHVPATAPMAEKEGAENPNEYTSHWVQHQTIKASQSRVDQDQKRQKVMEEMKRTPIEEWSLGGGSLYVFLLTKAERYLDQRALTRAEMAHAISYIFRPSLHAEKTARALCLDHLPAEPTTLDDRRPIYRLLAAELDTDGETVCDPLDPHERVVDLFNRMVLTLEVETGMEKPELRPYLNFRAINRIIDPSEDLLPKEDQDRLTSLWSSVVCQHNIRRSVTDHQIMMMLNNFDRVRATSKPSKITTPTAQGQSLKTKESYKKDKIWSNSAAKPVKCDICGQAHKTRACKIWLEGRCTICQSRGIPIAKIFHITADHIDKKSGYTAPSGGYGYAPAHLSTKENSEKKVEMLKMAANEALDAKKPALNDHLEGVQTEDGIACIRLELDDMLVTVKLDTGCSVPAVIDENYAKDLGLLEKATSLSTKLVGANGSKIECNKVIEVPARYKATSTMLKLTVMPECPSKLLIGLPAMKQLKLLSIFNEDVELINEIKVHKEVEESKNF